MKEFCGKVLIPSIIHESETWTLNLRERRRRRVFANMCILRLKGKKRNGGVRRKCESNLIMIKRVNGGVLNSFT